MKNLLKLASASLLAIALSGAAYALPMINGQLDLAKAGGVTVNFATDTVSFTGTPNSFVNFATGSYSVFAPVGGIPTTVANYVNFSYAVGPVNPGLILWSIDTATSDAWFKLLNITGVTESANGLVVTGTGTAWLTGFEETSGSWSFSADRSTAEAAFNFSSTNISPLTVADGGTTAMLLGLGLVGMSFVARRSKAA